MTSAIELAKYDRLSKLALKSALINNWNLESNPVWPLQEYFLLKWEGDYLRTQLKNGCIKRNNTNYLVVWHRCTPVQAFRSEWVLLSFRGSAAFEECYVLVKPFLEN